MKIRNNVIRETINNKNSVSDYIRYKQLNWYDHMRRMNEEKLRQKNLEWYPPRRKKRKASKFVDIGSNNWNETEGN